jgi:hypothetical protein
MNFTDGMFLGYLLCFNPDTWFKFVIFLGVLVYFIFRLLKSLRKTKNKRKNK